MLLSQQIEQDYIAAYKAREAVRLNTLRHIKTAAKNAQVSLMRPLEEAEYLDVIMKQVKQRQDSIEQFTQAGRQDLAVQEEAELAVLAAYMPKALSAEETNAAVDVAINETGAVSIQEMGKVMQAVLGKYKGQVDAKVLSTLVRERLASK